MRIVTIGPDTDFANLAGQQMHTPFGLVTILRAVRAQRHYLGASFEVRTATGSSTYYGLDDGATIVVGDSADTSVSLH
jgi:hypothetical protein